MSNRGVRSLSHTKARFEFHLAFACAPCACACVTPCARALGSTILALCPSWSLRTSATVCTRGSRARTSVRSGLRACTSACARAYVAAFALLAIAVAILAIRTRRCQREFGYNRLWRSRRRLSSGLRGSRLHGTCRLMCCGWCDELGC